GRKRAPPRLGISRTRGDRSHRGDEMDGAGTFSQVTSSADLKTALSVTSMLLIREDDDFGLRESSRDILQELHAIAMAEREIEQEKVRLVTLQQPHGASFVCPQTTDGKIRLVRNDGGDPTADEFV